MAIPSERVLEYFLYNFDNNGNKLGPISSRSAEDFIRAVRVRSSNPTYRPKKSGGLDRVIFLDKRNKKEFDFVVLFHRILNNNKVILETDPEFKGFLQSLTKSDLEDFITNDQSQIDYINSQIQTWGNGPWSIIQDPWNPDVIPSQELGNSENNIVSQPDPVSESEKETSKQKNPDFSPDKIYTFNVETNGVLISKEIGTFSIIDIGTPTEFNFDPIIDENLLLDEEFIESEYSGLEDDPALIFYKDNQSTEGSVEDNYVDPTLGPGEGGLIFDGRKFLTPDVSRRYPTNYILYIDHNKMPKPKLKKQGLINTKLKVEGGLTGNPNDSAAKSGYCPTPKNGKKYHTNKGITYAVWKKTFGTTNDNRFLDMNLTDWTKIFDNSYWNNNATSKYESVNCLYTSFAWGGSKAATITGAKKMLGVSDIDSVSEEKAVAALLSARAQLFINISQPGTKNNTFRKGWIVTAINNFISETYF